MNCIAARVKLSKGFLVSLTLSSLLITQSVRSQITVDSSMTPYDLVTNVLLGGGVQVSNVTFTGSSVMRGTFNGNSNIGMTSGVILASGFISTAIGPNNNPSAYINVGAPGDNDLTALIGGSPTYDAAILEFDFIPSSDTIQFNYVFGSEEYNEYVNSSYNDVFAFFLTGLNPFGPNYNGTNIALIPGTSIPVAINNVNNGYGPPSQPGGGPCNNCSYFQDNTNGNWIQYDAFTTVLKAMAPVVKCTSYHIKIAIADVYDGIYDSGVFLQAKSFSSTGVKISAASFLGDSLVYEGCGKLGTANYYFTRSLETDTANICFEIGGTAVNGVDYTDPYGNPIDSCITFLPGQDSVVISIVAAWDGTAEPNENITFTIPWLVGCDTVPIFASLYIQNVDSIRLSVTPDTTLCEGDSKTLLVIPSNGTLPYIYNWDNNASTTDQYLVTPPLGVHNYQIQVNDSCGNYASESVAITVNPVPISTFTLPEEICSENDADIVYTGNMGPGAQYDWGFGGGSLLSGSGQGPLVVNWQEPGTHTVTLMVTNLNCKSTITSDSINIVLCPLTIPNVMTPNGDQANQYFEITNLSYFKDSHLIIFNRWGRKVFESDDYDNKWDGRDCSDGTYFYVLILNDGKSYNGTITLLRH